MSVQSVLRRVAAIVLVATATLLATGCQREAGQVPELQGGAPVDTRTGTDEFALEGAGHGRHDGATAIELLGRPEVLAAARAELLQRREGKPYQCPIPADAPLPLQRA